MLAVFLWNLAQGAQAESRSTDLLNVYEAALLNSASLAAAEARRREAVEVIPQAKAQLLPNLRAGVAYQQVSSHGGEGMAGTYQAPRLTAALRQPLFDAARWYRLEGAGHEAEQAELDYVLAISGLVLEVAQAYGQALKAQVTAHSAQQEVQGLSQHVASTHARLISGMATIVDLAEARAALDQARAQSASAGHAVAATQAKLRQLTGLRPQTLRPLAIEPVEVLEDTPGTLLAQALQHSASLKRAEAQVSTAGAAVKAARGAHAPTLDAVVSHSRSDLSGTGSRTAPGLSQTLWAVELNVPLFDGGGTQSRVRAAAAQLQAAEYEQAALRQEIATQVSVYHSEWRVARQQVKAYREAEYSAMQLLKATRVGRDLGTRNTQDVIEAERRWYSAQRDREHARLDVWVSHLKLKHAVAPLTREDVVALNAQLLANGDWPEV
ncbi:TolC family outer membrane protein [Pseudomonas sp. KNUC1026]|uniref:TolC family outer membrane protein n=1 Tax=Pseudomonas sp. KNUC1026 TaxID=2893890 RepID=UPI001F3DC7A3|nr:TolC family outer membrane protein [Pseudomonas sp. KNUC1026]UFH49382.1 TolC family outer membrane protein [Pseudomonas sp. KNUC1026]